jgi:hypothetical protein
VLDPAVPTPSSVVGHDIGERHTRYADVVRYAERLAQAVPDRVSLVPIGHSYEGRPLLLLVVSSPANMARLGEVKAAMARMADPRGLDDAQAADLVRRTPAVTWDNFGIDGNESAAVEAAMELAYRLAASRGGPVEKALQDVVAVLNVCHNPESRERFVTWYDAHRVGPRGTADPQALEHHGPWAMDTNDNHYQVDLNRDAAWATQVETQHVIRAFNEWRPVTFVDHHGEAENFFFPPPALPVNPHIPAAQARWLEEYGKAIADASDRRGWSYFTGEIFDAFYPGYWDAYPLLRGSTGMTFETTGGGSGGLQVERDDRTVVTLRDGVDRHVEGALAVVRLTAARREERLRDFLRFRREATVDGARGSLRAYALAPGADPGRVAEAVGVLLRHGIEVHRLQQAAEVDDARGYRDARRRRLRLPAGTFVVDLAQPEHRLISALLEPRTEQQPQFLAEERRKREANRARGRQVPEEPAAFYDVTGWSLPLTYDLEAWALPRLPHGLERVEVTPRPGGAVSGVPARAAYLVDPRPLASARLVLALLREGFKVAVNRRAFSHAGREWPAGTFVLRTERNAASLHERLPALAAESGAEAVGVDTSRTQGGVDLGSPQLDALRLPRIAVAADEPTDENSYGAVWFLLEQRLASPFTALRTAQLDTADLSRYDVLVLPDGDAEEYLLLLGDRGLERLRAWTREGGVLVCMGGAAQLAASPKVRWTRAELLGHEEADDDPDDDDDGGDEADDTAPASPAARAATSRTAVAGATAPEAEEDEELGLGDDEVLETDGPLDREQARREQEAEETPGAIFLAEVSGGHFLGFGLPAELPVLVDSSRVFTASRTGATVVRLQRDSPLLSGFTWPEAEERLRGAAYAIDEPLGRGHVIVLAEDVLFRNFWRGTEKLFTNAVLLAPSLH